MMKKQEFVPRKISEKPLYELKSVEDIPVSELYQVKINGKEQRVYHTEFFDFVSFLDENEKAEVEVTVNEPFQKAVIRPAAAQIPFTEEGNKISISLPGQHQNIPISSGGPPLKPPPQRHLCQVRTRGTPSRPAGLRMLFLARSRYPGLPPPDHIRSRMVHTHIFSSEIPPLFI